MSSCVVRRVETSDGELLKRVRLAALRDTPSAFGSTYDAELRLSDADWDQRARAGSDGSQRVTFFAEAGGTIVGVIGAFRAEPAAERVDLVSMWVAPDARRRGIARELVAAVVDWATTTSASQVALWVTRGNEPAASLYAAMGFEATGNTQPLPWDSSTEEVEYVLPITLDTG